MTEEKKGMSFNEFFGTNRSDTLLHPSIKKEIQSFITMLQTFYDSKIDVPTATEIDALEYIPLFTINAALVASMLGVTYEEYLMAVDYMIRALDLEERELNAEKVSHE